MAVASAICVSGPGIQQHPAVDRDGTVQVNIGRGLGDPTIVTTSNDPCVNGIPGRENEGTIDGGGMGWLDEAVGEIIVVQDLQQNGQRVPVYLIVIVAETEVIYHQIRKVVDHGPIRIVD